MAYQAAFLMSQDLWQLFYTSVGSSKKPCQRNNGGYNPNKDRQKFLQFITISHGFTQGNMNCQSGSLKNMPITVNLK